MILAFLRGLEKAPTFLVPIINPPFADNSPHLSPTADLIQKISEGIKPSTARTFSAFGHAGRTIRPAVSLMILKAAAAVI